MLAIGQKYRDRLEMPLQKLGVSVLWLPDNPQIDPRLSGHADLNVCVPDHDIIIAAEMMENALVNKLTNAKFIFITTQGNKYPKDAGLCVCTTGKYTIYNPSVVSPILKQYITGSLIEVTQGYTKCSVCVVSPDAIITSDDIIASKAADAGLDVLHISPGHIFLDGFPYGFIGGASFMVGERLIAFTGGLDGHPDKDRIIAFIVNHGKNPVFLTKDGIFDIGGAIELP